MLNKGAGWVDSFSVDPAVMPTASYGSAFTMTNGNLAFLATNGKLVQISVSNPTGTNPTFTQISTVDAPANAKSNATNCATALESRLSVKKVGPESVIVGHDIEWTVTVTNEGPGTTSGFVLQDLLPSSVDPATVTTRSADAACGVPDSSRTITCNGGQLLNGSTAVVYVSAKAPMTPGPLVNQARVIGNEDPEPADWAKAETQVELETVVDESTTIADTTVDEESLPTKTNIGGKISYTNGVITYVPPTGFSGFDSFVYEQNDGTEVTVNITVTPTADPDTRTTTVDSDPVVVDGSDLVGLGNGSDLKLTGVSGATNGTVDLDPETGDVTFTPTSGFSGTGSFAYELTDAEGQTATNTITVTVTPVTDPDARTTKVDVPVTLEGDELVGLGRGSDLELTSVSGATHGSVSLEDGVVTFTPAPGFSGTGSFTYELTDGADQTATNTVTVTIHNVFAKGPAVESGVTTPHKTPVTIPVASISTPEGAPLDPGATKVVEKPKNGTVTPNQDGSVTYTPTGGYVGDDSFDVEVCDINGECTTVTIPVTVSPNSVAATNDSAKTTAGKSVVVDVRENDTTASGQSLDVPKDVTKPAHGTAKVDAKTGEITYTPEAGFSGTDTFTYTVCDTSTPTPACSNTATVTVTVTNVFTPGDATEGVTTPQNEPVDVPLEDIVTPSGAPVDPESVKEKTPPADGTITVDEDGTVTYTPKPGFSGGDEFTLDVCDENGDCTEVTIPVTVGKNTVTAADDTGSTKVGTPVVIMVGTNDSSKTGQALELPKVTKAPGHGTATVLTDGTIRYVPAAGFSGKDTFEYTLCDTSIPTAVCDTAMVTVTVTNVFTDGPVVEDGVTIPHKTPVTIPVTSISTPEGAPLDPGATKVVENPKNGKVTVDPQTGESTYMPKPGYSGDDEFDLKVCDKNGDCTTVKIPVKVSPNSVAASSDSAKTTAGKSVVVDVRKNDTTASGQELDVPTVTTQPAHGTVTVGKDGTITYTPNAGFSGEDTFEYQVCDTSTPQAVCDTATVTVTVTNDVTPGKPTTTGVTTGHGKVIQIPLEEIGTPTGAPLDPTSLRVITDPKHGTAKVDPKTGEITYTPAEGFSGEDSLVVEICDTSTPAQCTTHTVKVKVGSNAVELKDDKAVSEAGEPVVINVGENDRSENGRPLGAPSIVDGPKHGTVEVLGDGTIRYTPDAGYVGSDSFTYSRCDDSSPVPVCDVATVTVAVSELSQTGVSHVLTTGAIAAGLAFAGLLLVVVGRRRRV